jgi:hypothetical protein
MNRSPGLANKLELGSPGDPILTKYMNNINTANDNTNTTPASTTTEEAIDPVFMSIEGEVGLSPFMVSMLRVGQFLTAKHPVVREVTAERISKILFRKGWHRYSPLEIRDLWEFYHYYMEAGGVEIQSSELPFPHRGPHHYHFTFTKRYTAEETRKMREITVERPDNFANPNKAGTPSNNANNNPDTHDSLRTTGG